MARSYYGRQREARGVRRRSLAGVLLAGASMVTLPVALVWACTPSGFGAPASLASDRSAYNAGDAVGVRGDNFRPSSPVQLTLQPPSGAAQAVPTPANTDAQGHFEASFTLPSDSSSGDYALRATTDYSTARVTFTVAAQDATLPPPLGPQPPDPGPAAPGDQPANRKAALKRGVAKCKQRHRAGKRMTPAKRRKLARKRAACIRSVKRKYS